MYNHTNTVCLCLQPVLLGACRACTGQNNLDCLLCEYEALYRVTTNQPTSRACVTAAECASIAISRFGDRTCSSLNVRVRLSFI